MEKRRACRADRLLGQHTASSSSRVMSGGSGWPGGSQSRQVWHVPAVAGRSWSAISPAGRGCPPRRPRGGGASGVELAHTPQEDPILAGVPDCAARRPASCCTRPGRLAPSSNASTRSTSNNNTRPCPTSPPDGGLLRGRCPELRRRFYQILGATRRAVGGDTPQGLGSPAQARSDRRPSPPLASPRYSVQHRRPGDLTSNTVSTQLIRDELAAVRGLHLSLAPSVARAGALTASTARLGRRSEAWRAYTARLASSCTSCARTQACGGPRVGQAARGRLPDHPGPPANVAASASPLRRAAGVQVAPVPRCPAGDRPAAPQEARR